MYPRDRSTWNLVILYSGTIFPLIWSNGLRKAKRQPPMVCASPKNSKKRRTIFCSCAHLVLKKTAYPVHMTAIVGGSRNAEIFRDGILCSNGRILSCKKLYKNINCKCAKCFLWWFTLNEPRNPCVHDTFNYYKNKCWIKDTFSWTHKYLLA